MISLANKAKPWRRDKVIAVLLAVFFGPWTYIYTLKRDVTKAAITLGINLSIVIINFSILYPATKNTPQGEGESIVFMMVFPIIIFFLTWIVVITDTTVAKEWEITKFKNKSKTTGILLSIFFGPWAWLYTYSKDWWKFGLGVLAGYGFVLAYSLTSNGIFMALWVLSILVIWVTSLINIIRRNPVWYEELD